MADENSAFSALSGNERFFAYQDGSGLRVWDRTQHALLILRQPLARHNVASFHFSWDGNTIFYSTYDGQHASLWRQSLAPLGSPVKLDTNQPLPGPIDLVGPPSPDGSIVNIGVGSGAAARNYLLVAGSGQPHALLPPGGVGPVGWWSPDGRHLVYIIYHGDQPVLSGIARVQS